MNEVYPLAQRVRISLEYLTLGRSMREDGHLALSVQVTIRGGRVHHGPRYWWFR